MPDALDPGAVDLAVIARIVEQEGDGDGGERREPDARERQARIDEDQEHQRRDRAEEVDRGGGAPAHRARARQRGERHQQPADQPERNDHEAEHEGLAEPGEQQRQGAGHDGEIEELLEQRLHQALRQANRVSSQRPSTTTGMKRITYATAPIVSGVALPAKDCPVVAWLRISETPITIPSAVFLAIASVRLVRGATVSRTAWGSTM